MQRLTHPNLLIAYGVSLVGPGEYIIVYQDISGDTLLNVIKGHSLFIVTSAMTLRIAVDIASQVCNCGYINCSISFNG